MALLYGGCWSICALATLLIEPLQAVPHDSDNTWPSAQQPSPWPPTTGGGSKPHWLFQHHREQQKRKTQSPNQRQDEQRHQAHHGRQHGDPRRLRAIANAKQAEETIASTGVALVAAAVGVARSSVAAGVVSHIDSISTVASGSAIGTGASGSEFLKRLFGFLVWFVAVFFFALYYRAAKDDLMPPPRRASKRHPGERQEWGVGLFTCHEEPKLCLFSCCCPAVRWSDTMGMAKLVAFMTALEIFIWATFADTLIKTNIVLLAVLVFYRQKLRAKFDIPNGTCWTITEDVCAMLCCTVCAITQEARQVEHVALPSHVSTVGYGPASSSNSV